jgi:hypothetical protein
MHTKRVPLKFIIAIGAGLLIVGFALFLHSLGSGGGWFAISLMLIGGISIVTAIVFAVVRAVK